MRGFAGFLLWGIVVFGGSSVALARPGNNASHNPGNFQWGFPGSGEIFSQLHCQSLMYASALDDVAVYLSPSGMTEAVESGTPSPIEDQVDSEFSDEPDAESTFLKEESDASPGNIEGLDVDLPQYRIVEDGSEYYPLDDIDLDAFELPMVINEEVVKWVDFFLTRGRLFFADWLTKSTKYLPMVEDILEEEGLPRDLAYVAMIESGFSPGAHSRMNAVGMWQLMKPTGQHYGTRINRWLDERRDPEKATRAAASHLRDLYDRFGDWYLSLAAYNAGPSRVARAMARTGSSDYWTLAQGNYLPPETRNYVPRLLASILIARNPDRFEMENLDYADPLLFDSVKITDSTSLEEIADHIAVDYEELVQLNPELRTDRTPPGPYLARLPKGTRALFEASFVSYGERGDYRNYKVRAGDSLISIARKYDVDVAGIQRVNGMKTTFLRIGETLLIPNRRMVQTELGEELGQDRHWIEDENLTEDKSAESREEAKHSYSTHRDTAEANRFRHTVRPGETLSHIALRYGVPVETLQRWNQLTDEHQIRAGGTLLVRNGKHASNQDLNSIETQQNQVAYQVKAGDSVWSIARRFDVRMADLLRWNSIDISSNLQIGQNLNIPLK